jgi:hypothetical protein
MAGAAGSAAGGPPVDRTPPTNVSKRLTRYVAPNLTRDETDLEGATAVAEDTNIVITFSEPMDRQSVQAAYQSASIPAVTYAWSEDDTKVTIDPNVDLLAADGGPDVAAQSYAISITDTAEDKAGNRLSTWTGSFATYRVVSADYPVNGSRVHYFNGTSVLGCNGASALAGDDGARGMFIALEVPLSALPAGIIHFSSARIRGAIDGSRGGPFGKFGDIHLYSIDQKPLTAVNWTTPVAEDLGLFASSASGSVATNVRVPLAEAYAVLGTAGVVQYRVSFPSPVTADTSADWVSFACEQFSLSARYIVP